MTNEDLFRAAAVLAAVVVFFSDQLVALGQGFLARPGGKKPKPAETQPEAPEEDSSLADMRTILELASRLKARGCDAGVSLCQQLIDVMLGSSPTKAKK
jgi:hypothetical protein